MKNVKQDIFLLVAKSIVLCQLYSESLRKEKERERKTMVTDNRRVKQRVGGHPGERA